MEVTRETRDGRDSIINTFLTKNKITKKLGIEKIPSFLLTSKVKNGKIENANINCMYYAIP